METFKKTNDQLDKTMRSHLIDDIDSYGIWDDDYKIFLNKRGKKILRLLENRLHPKL